MQIKSFDSLPDDAKYIRETVFVKEQGFREEFDKTDSSCVHLVSYDGEKPAATVRFFSEDGGKTYYIGRLAVLKEYRQNGVGAKLLRQAQELIKEKGGEKIILHSQLQAQGFYEKQGYRPFGETDFDESCPHIWMEKDIRRL